MKFTDTFMISSLTIFALVGITLGMPNIKTTASTTATDQVGVFRTLPKKINLIYDCTPKC